jgi:hypothetical protein
MTAITQGTDIKPLNGAIIRRGTLGTTVTKGDPVTLQSDGFWDPTDTTTNAQLTVGIAVQGGLVGDVIDIVVYGPVQCISGATPGSLAYGSNTAGALDDAVGTKDLVVGYIESATVLFVQPQIIDFS